MKVPLIEDGIEKLLLNIHSTLNISWAWSIIVLTIIVRLFLSPLIIKQTRSTLAIQKLQPHAKKLQKKYKNNHQAMGIALRELYKDNNVNPAASILPSLIQIPILFSLYFVIKDFVPPINGSHDFSFLGTFINDIRTVTRDAHLAGVTIVLTYLCSQLAAIHVTMNNQSPQQRVTIMLLSVLFTTFVLYAPIAVALYWITTNIWSVCQYILVMRLAKADN